MKSKKGDLSINIIIVAILALLVLVLLVFIFSGKLKAFGKGTESCASKGGTCTTEGYTGECIKLGTCNCPSSIENAIYITGTDCEKTSKICCKQVY